MKIMFLTWFGPLIQMVFPMDQLIMSAVCAAENIKLFLVCDPFDLTHEKKETFFLIFII